MKKVHTRDMVAHLWANQSQDEARVAGGNFYFTGPTIFSYGSHFVCGHVTDWRDADGQRVTLVNSGSYSNTTAKHMHSVRSAIRNHGRVIYLAGLKRDTVQSRAICENVATLAAAQSRAAFQTATQKRKAPTIQYFLKHAATLADAARLAADNAPKDYRAKVRAILRGLPTLPADIDAADYHSMKPHRDEVQRAEARAALAGLADTCRKAWDSATGPVDQYSGARGMDTAAQRADNFLAQCRTAAKRAGVKLPAGLPSAAAIAARRLELAPLALAERITDGEYQTARSHRSMMRDHARRVPVRYGVAVAGAAPGRSLASAAHYAERVQEYCDLVEHSATIAARCADATRIQGRHRRAAIVDQCKEHASVARQAIADAQRADHPRAAVREIDEATRAVQTLHRKAEVFPERMARLYRGIASGLPTLAELQTLRAGYAAQFAAADAQRLADWRSGLGNAGMARDLAPHPMLRLVPKGADADSGRIETSWGAQITARHCKLVWRLVCKTRAAGVAWSGSVSLDHFNMTSVNADGSIRVGCHDIPYSELELIALELGFADAAVESVAV